MDYKHMTAPCGLDCFNCFFYSGYEDKELQALALKEKGYSMEVAICKGCRNENGKIPFPIKCNLYPCAEKKGLHFAVIVQIFLVIICIRMLTELTRFHIIRKSLICV